MSDRDQLVVTRFAPADLQALDAAADVFACTRAELVRHVAMIFARGVTLIGPPPAGSSLGNLAFRGQWERQR